MKWPVKMRRLCNPRKGMLAFLGRKTSKAHLILSGNVLSSAAFPGLNIVVTRRTPVPARNWYLVALPLLLSVWGCAVIPEPIQSGSLYRSMRAPAKGEDSQVVKLDVAVLERPVGDAFLNHELWQHTDEMIVSLDRKAAVEDNGYRVGQIVGMTPSKLQELLTSPRCCLNPRQRIFASGNSVNIYLSSLWPQTEFEIQSGKNLLPATFDQARFGLDVKATLTADGRTKLQFTPKVETGEVQLPFQPDPIQQTWTLKVERPSKSYKEAGWEVVLGPGEYLVVGPILEKPKSLGHRSLVVEEGASVQRLLVLRTSRTTGADNGEPTLEDIARSGPSPCLAAQAGMTAIRASGE